MIKKIKKAGTIPVKCQNKYKTLFPLWAIFSTVIPQVGENNTRTK